MALNIGETLSLAFVWRVRSGGGAWGEGVGVGRGWDGKAGVLTTTDG